MQFRESKKITKIGGYPHKEMEVKKYKNNI